MSPEVRQAMAENAAAAKARTASRLGALGKLRVPPAAPKPVAVVDEDDPHGRDRLHRRLAALKHAPSRD